MNSKPGVFFSNLSRSVHCPSISPIAEKRTAHKLPHPVCNLPKPPTFHRSSFSALIHAPLRYNPMDFARSNAAAQIIGPQKKKRKPHFRTQISSLSSHAFPTFGSSAPHPSALCCIPSQRLILLLIIISPKLSIHDPTPSPIITLQHSPPRQPLAVPDAIAPSMKIHDRSPANFPDTRKEHAKVGTVVIVIGQISTVALVAQPALAGMVRFRWSIQPGGE